MGLKESEDPCEYFCEACENSPESHGRYIHIIRQFLLIFFLYTVAEKTETPLLNTESMCLFIFLFSFTYITRSTKVHNPRHRRCHKLVSLFMLLCFIYKAGFAELGFVANAWRNKCP